MKKIIGLGIFSITIIYPLLYPLGQVFRNVTTTQFLYTAQKALMNSFLMYLSEILLGCINLCYKCWSLKSDKDLKLSKVEIENEFSFLEQQQEAKLKVLCRVCQTPTNTSNKPLWYSSHSENSATFFLSSAFGCSKMTHTISLSSASFL